MTIRSGSAVRDEERAAYEASLRSLRDIIDGRATPDESDSDDERASTSQLDLEMEETIVRRTKDQLTQLAALKRPTFSGPPLPDSPAKGILKRPNLGGDAAMSSVNEPGPSTKRSRKVSNVSVEVSADISTVSNTSTSRKGKGPARKPKEILPPHRLKEAEFAARFASYSHYAEYLAGERGEVHKILFHKETPLAGVRAFFVCHERRLSKKTAINLDNLTRLGGSVHKAFLPLSTSSPIWTTHVIVDSDSLKFKDVLQKLSLKEDADLVGPDIADGSRVHERERDVWVVKLDWLHECCNLANKHPDDAKRIQERLYLIECAGDKKGRKRQLIERKMSEPAVSDPALEPFRMPEESQISTEEQRRQQAQPGRASSPDSYLVSAHIPDFDGYSQLSFEDLAVELELARRNIDKFIDEDDEIASVIGEEPSKMSDGDSEGNVTDEEEVQPGQTTYITNAKGRKVRKQFQGSKYRCDTSSKLGAGREGPNEPVAAVFDELALYYEKSKLPNAWWRVKGYRTAAGALRNVDIKIETHEEARKLPGIGEKTATKLVEIVQTGKSTQLSTKSAMEKVQDIFTKMYGVGPTKAADWYHAGMRTLEDVHNCSSFGIILHESQKLGLKYYDDLNERMSRTEVAQHFKIIKQTAFHIDPYMIVECMGSFRRGQPDCGDIDILVTRDTGDGRDHSGLVQRLVENLFAQGLIRYTLSNPEDWRSLDAKWMGLLCGTNGKMRRIDILGVPHDELGAALIYFTGNDIFNRSLRLKARHLGFSLNQRGLFKDVFRDRKTNEKRTAGQRIASRTEQEIFDMLGTKWRPPTERLP